MSDPFTPAEAEAFERACILGLSRNPLPVPAALRDAARGEVGPLPLLALFAQRARFRTPAAVSAAVTRRRVLPEDPRPPMPAHVRQVFLELLEMRHRATAAAIAPVVLALLVRRGFRVHPFDLPRLEPLLRRADDRHLGPAEEAFLKRNSDGKAVGTGSSFDGEIDDTNWTSFPKSEALEFIRRRRAEDPAHGRDLIEAGLASLGAPLRADIVEVLRPRLSDADRPLLERLAKDRSAKVQDAARALLGSMPGTEAYAEKLARAVAMFGLRAKGLLRRSSALEFKPPGKDERERRINAEAALAGIRVADLASLLGFSSEGFVAALPDDEVVLLQIAKAALAEGAVDLAIRVLARGDAPWPMRLLQLRDAIEHLLPEQRLAVIRALFATGGDVEGLPWAEPCLALASLLDGPLPEDLADQFLAFDGWQRAVRRFIAGETVSFLTAYGPVDASTVNPPILAYCFLGLAIILPASRYATLQRHIEPLAPDLKEPALRFIAFATALEQAGAHP